MKKLFLLAIFMLSLFACSSLDVDSAETNRSVTHEIITTNKGTKSEGTTGKLKVGNYYIPAIFMYVTYSEKSYKFIANNKLWGQHEYFPMEKKLAETMSKKEINQSDLDLGYYIGTEKLKGTPTNWIYVKWNTNSAYIDLERIEEVLKVKPFSEAKQLNLPLGIEIK